MDLARSKNSVQYFEKIETVQHREFINAHNNCVLCGTVLELKHVRFEQDNSVKEEANCPQCELRTRAKFYSLI